MQYKTIEPYLKRKTATPIGDKQLFQSVEDRKKLVGINLQKKNKFRNSMIMFRMECMNVFFVHVVQHHVQVIGGMLINILDQLFLCKLISLYEYFCFDD